MSTIDNLLTTAPSANGVPFFDDFHRADSSLTGNGWVDTFVGFGSIAAGISDNHQYMISNNNGQPVTYRTDISQTNNIAISGEFSSQTLSDGYYQVGINAVLGYGSSGYNIVFADQDFSNDHFVRISDESGTLAEAPFIFNNTDHFAYEWDITPENWSYLYVWDASTETRPLTPTLSWTNSGNIFHPHASGDRLFFTSGLQGHTQPTETMFTYLFEVTPLAPVNQAPPEITSNGGGDAAAVSIAENSAAVTTVTAADPDAGDMIIYSILGGDDAALFTIDMVTGALSFVLAPDFENPADAGHDNVYDVVVQASDDLGGTDSQAIAVSVANVVGVTIHAGNGGQTTRGSGEEDLLHGGNGKDILSGGVGNDTISGNNGADILDGGPGHNILTGGNGPDTFVFGSDATGYNRITDFSKGDHVAFLNGVTVANTTALSEGTELHLNTGGNVLLVGVTVSDWDMLI